MGLSQADLIYLQRLPDAKDLTPAQLRDVRRLLQGADPGEGRLLRSLLSHAPEIEQREAERREAANRRNIIEQRLNPAERRLAAVTHGVGARRMAEHKQAAAMRRWHADNPLPSVPAEQIEHQKERQAAERRIAREVKDEMAERRATWEQEHKQQYHDLRSELQDL